MIVETISHIAAMVTNTGHQRQEPFTFPRGRRKISKLFLNTA